MAIFWRSVICFSLLLAQPPAWAGLLPGADRPGTQVRLGSGPTLGAAVGLGPHLEAGLSVSSAFLYFQNFSTLRYSAYGLFQLYQENGFYMAFLAGAYGNAYLPSLQRHSLISLQGGAAFAYDLNRDLTLRLNIAPGVSLMVPPQGWEAFAPLSGIELAWRLNPGTELSVGYTGNGDILGVSWRF